MSKHDVIVRNLKALTRTRSFNAAVKHWEVRSLVALPKRQTQACELCGTRFCQGAQLQHEQSGATILVGGTCLETIRKSHFPPGFNFDIGKRSTDGFLRGIYGDLIDPGNWLKWLSDNAPRRLAPTVADLLTFGTALNKEELNLLVRFHDRKRLFRRTALLPNARSIETLLGVKIPLYVTVDQARRLEAKISRKPTRLRIPVLANDHADRVRSSIMADPELKALWLSLTNNERRAVNALVALDEQAVRENGSLCPAEITVNWPLPRCGPMFVWNYKVGLGFVGAFDSIGESKARIWLWRSGRYRKSIYDLQYWRGVIGCSDDLVLAIEERAFSSRPTTIGKGHS